MSCSLPPYVKNEPNARSGVPGCMKFLGVIALLSVLPAHAQHCAYDFRSVIVVRPHLSGDSMVIAGLRITLLDSNNLPVVHHGQPWNLFRRNVEPDRIRHRHGTFDRSDQFPFAQDNYILVVPNGFDTARMKVLVQDERDIGPLNERRDQWPMRFKQQVVALTNFDLYPLCGVFDEEVYPTMANRPSFHPIDITLHPR